MKLYQALIISLLFAAMMLGISNPALAGTPTVSFVAGTSAGWDFHPVEGDIARNNIVDWNDLAVLAQNWLASGCASGNNWCSGADFDQSTGVDFIDYAILAENWGQQAGQNILLQTIYGAAQDANGTITANTAKPVQNLKGLAMAFNVPSSITGLALDTGTFKLTALGASKTVEVRLFNVTGQNYLLYSGHPTVSRTSPGGSGTKLLDVTVTVPSPAPSHPEGAANCSNMVIGFGPLEITAGDYLLTFDCIYSSSTSLTTACSMVYGSSAAISAAMGTYPDSTPLPKRATVSTSTGTGNTFYYYLSSSTSTNYSAASNQLACQITTTFVNHPPVVNAGTNQTVEAPNAANLSGTATDDGLPNPPGMLTTTWSMTSGPGTVTFGDASALNTTATFSALGTYVLRLTASDSQLSAYSEVTIIYTNNTAPVVNAGTDQTVGILDATNLAGTVTDDGLPNPPGVTTQTWTVTSGPGTVTFGDANSPTSSVTFSTTGTYVLRLTASDSQLSSYDEVTYTVVAGSLNAAPVVSAGPDVTVTLPATVATLNGTATDDGKPNPPGHLTITWTQQSGPGTVTFASPHSAVTTATADTFGTYLLRLTAFDGALTSYADVNATWQDYTYGGYPPIPTGGAGGTVVHVTNLNDSGAGSFRTAFTGGSNRIIVFDISGSIWVESEIRTGQSNITVDGFTAPGKGITIVSDDANCGGDPIGIKAGNNIIIRNIRVRHSLPTLDLTGASENANKCIMIWQGSGIIIDHCSLTGAGDSSIACDADSVDHVTVSRCLFAGSVEAFRSHGTYMCAHHNLFTICNRRQPRIYSAGPYWDMRNNVVDQWTNTGTNVYAADSVNLINNYYTKGYLNWGACQDGYLSGYASTNTNLYINGNVSACGKTPPMDSFTQLSAPNLEPVNITTTDANTAFSDVLSDVGATPIDAIDAYYNTLNGGVNPPPTQ